MFERGAVLRLGRPYHVRVWDAGDGYLAAQCRELPGAIAQGKTRDEVLQNINEAIDLVLTYVHPILTGAS